MTNSRYGKLAAHVSALGIALGLLAACGGGGGNTGFRPPAPAPAPTPTPTPTPPPGGGSGFVQQDVPRAFDTPELRRSDGPTQHNAPAVWAQGHTGAGVTIGVIDTGIDDDSPEFAGRLSPRSTDIYGNRALEGPDDHGTLVSLVAAARRNGEGIVGIAYDATILAIRTDDPGSCGGDNLQDPTSDCAFFDNAIADSVDYAVANGAKVINISLGGPGTINNRLRASVRSAVEAGLIVVVAAGNDGLANLTPFAAELSRAGSGGVVVVGSVDQNYAISDFSNKAGTNQQQYLTARGEGICCVYENGEIFVDNEGFVYLFSGTSFAAPQVAGAAALLAQAFPNLTGREIAEILLASAFDAGDTGADAVYGQGILDIFAAFQPIGTTAIAGQRVPLSLADGVAVGSPAMGDAFATASLPSLITDKYSRAFATDLARNLRGAAVPQRLHGAIGQAQRSVSSSAGPATAAFSIDARGRGVPRAAALQLSGEDAERARVLAAQIALRVSPGTQIGFGYGYGADGIAAGLQGQERPAFMIAGEASGDRGMLARSDAAFAVRQQLGDWGITARAETGSTQTAAAVVRAAQLRGQPVREDISRLGLSLDRQLGAVEATLGLDWTQEEQTVLGARFHEGFGLAGSDSVFLDLDLGWAFAPGWRAGASARRGTTALRDAPLVGDGSRLTSSAWSLDLERRGLLGETDRLALRMSQPLRVESGGLNLLLPSSYDYATLKPGYSLQSLSLAPEGRELVGELSYRTQLWGGNAGASLFYRHQPGHYAQAPADAGVALRWSSAF